MAEAEGIPPTASTASVGPGINYIDNRCYAYSGEITVTSGGQTLLEFTSTEAGYIVATVQFLYSGAFSAIITYKILLNDNVIGAYSNSGNVASSGPEPDSTIPIIIPPQTKVKLTGISDTSSRPQSAILVGRVYGAV